MKELIKKHLITESNRDVDQVVFLDLHSDILGYSLDQFNDIVEGKINKGIISDISYEVVSVVNGQIGIRVVADLYSDEEY